MLGLLVSTCLMTLMTSYGFVNRFSYDCDFVISLETFRLRTTGLHQGTVSIYGVRLFEPQWLLVIGWWVRFKALLSLGTLRSNDTVDGDKNVA